MLASIFKDLWAVFLLLCLVGLCIGWLVVEYGRSFLADWRAARAAAERQSIDDEYDDPYFDRDAGDRDDGPAKAAPFFLTCAYCDAGSDMTTVAQAAAAGWRDLEPVERGAFWHVGVCPACAARIDGVVVFPRPRTGEPFRAA
jgi:hypothetical protein